MKIQEIQTRDDLIVYLNDIIYKYDQNPNREFLLNSLVNLVVHFGEPPRPLKEKYLKVLDLMNTTLIEFKEVRAKQKEYFKTRQPTQKKKSRELEKQIDAKLKRWIPRVEKEIRSTGRQVLPF